MVSDPRGAAWSGAWPTCCGSPSSTATSPTAGTARTSRRRRAKRRSAAASSSSSAAKSSLPEKTLTVEAHFLRKPGQSEVDPATGEATVRPVRELDPLRDHGPELQEAVRRIGRSRHEARRSVALIAICAGRRLWRRPAHAICSSCNIQSKNPSTTEPGKFDYRVSCIIDESGDEVNSVVTAATDEEAIELTKKKGCYDARGELVAGWSAAQSGELRVISAENPHPDYGTRRKRGPLHRES